MPLLLIPYSKELECGDQLAKVVALARFAFRLKLVKRYEFEGPYQYIEVDADGLDFETARISETRGGESFKRLLLPGPRLKYLRGCVAPVWELVARGLPRFWKSTFGVFSVYRLRLRKLLSLAASSLKYKIQDLAWSFADLKIAVPQSIFGTPAFIGVGGPGAAQ